MKDGEETWVLSDPSVVEVLTAESNEHRKGCNEVVLQNLLERSEGGVNCWVCFDCLRALER